MSSTTVKNVLKILGDALADREQELNKYSDQPDNYDTDVEKGSTCPVFDIFHPNSASSVIASIKMFAPDFFDLLCFKFEPQILKRYNFGRKSKVNSKDAFFLTLDVLKNSGQWVFIAQIFEMKGPNFERLVMRYIKKVKSFCTRPMLSESNSILRWRP